MTRNEAFLLVLKSNKNFSRLFTRLVNWNENKSISENAKALGMMTVTAYQFKSRYHLKATKVRVRNYDSMRTRNVFEKYKKVWKPNATLKENAKTIGKPVSQAYFISRRYQLPYIKITKASARIVISKVNDKARVEKMLALRNLGFNKSQIGEIIGISRERVRQLINP